MREIKFEYGFQSANGIVKKVYHLSEIPNIKQLCDIWDELPIVYVREFTGLKDKNGKEIYEGDILKLTHRTYWDYDLDDSAKYEDIVCVKSESLTDTKCYYLTSNKKWDNGHSYSDWDDDWAMDLSNVEIIGNIHEHKHLLNQ